MKSTAQSRVLLAAVALLAVTCSGAAASATSATTGADPAINRPYINPDFARWVDVFERPGREVYDRRFDIVDALRLKPGMDVADIGAGTGLFSRLMAQRVGPDGTVYAVDVAASFVANVLRTAREQGLTNIEGVVNSQASADLAENSVDLVFICDTYHHFERPFDMMRSLHRALREEGELVIVDFRRDPRISNPWVMGHVRAGEQAVIEELELAGFRLLAAPDLLRTNFFLRFVKE